MELYGRKFTEEEKERIESEKRFRNTLEVFQFKNKRHGFGIQKGNVGIQFRKNDAEYIIEELTYLLKKKK